MTTPDAPQDIAPIPTPEQGISQHIPIADREAAYQLALKQPGLHVDGLGDLPKTVPFPERHRMFKRAQGTPDPERVDQALALRDEFNKGSFEIRHFDNFANYLIQELLAGRIDIPYGEIRQIVGFRKEELAREIASVCQSFPGEYQVLQEEGSELVRQKKQERLDRAEKYANSKEFRQSHRDEEIEARQQSFLDHTKEDADRQEQRDREKYCPDLYFRPYPTQNMIANRMFDKEIATAQDSRTLARAHVRKTARNVFFEFAHTLENEVVASAHKAFDVDSRDATRQGGTGALAAIVRDVISRQPHLPLATKLSQKLEAALMLDAPDVFDQWDEKPAFDGTQWAGKFFFESLARGEVSPEPIVAAFYDGSGNVPSVAQLPERLRTIYELAEIAERKPTLEGFLELQRMRGKLINPSQVLQTIATVEKNTRWGFGENPQLIPMTDCGYEQWEQGRTLNTQIVDPTLPSTEALKFIRSHPESPYEIPPVLGPHWDIIAALLKKQGLTGKEWHEWCLSTKQLGLSSLARRERNREIGRVLVGTKHKKENTDHFENDAVQRMPDQEEILVEAARRLELRTRRNVAYEAWIQLAVPLRVDRDEGWNKYTFSPSQWMDLYGTAYEILRRDATSGGHPDSYAASLRTSIIRAISGPHDQYYKIHWGDSYSEGRADFDEFDALMFLPSIAAENGNDPGFFLLANRLVIQMDDDVRLRYQAEISGCLDKLASQLPYIHYMNIVGPRTMTESTIPQSGLTINISNHADRSPHLDTHAIDRYNAQPNLRYTLPRYIWVVKDERGNTRPMTRAEYDKATAYADSKKSDRESGKRSIYMTEALGLDPENHAWVWTPELTQEMLDQIDDPRDVIVEFYLPWADQDLDADIETGEIRPRIRPDIILADGARAIGRLAQTSPDLVPIAEHLAQNEAATNLGPLAAAADIVSILTGKSMPPDDVSWMLAQMDRVQSVAARLRGASDQEVEGLLAHLDGNPVPGELSPEGHIQQVWQASGHLEREAIAAQVIRSVAAAHRISIARILEQIRDHKIKDYAIQLQQDADVSPDEALNLAQSSIAFSFRRSADTILEASLKQTGQGPPGSQNDKKRTHDFRNVVIGEVAQTMAELASVTNYHYASTHWLQVIDQLFAQNGQDYLSSEGKVNLYCVQSSYLLYEMLKDVLAPIEGLPWYQPPQLSIALADEQYGMPLEEFYQKLSSRHEKPRDDDQFNHYYVLLSLPRASEADQQFFLMLDQTEGEGRVFSSGAIERENACEIIIDSRKSTLIRQGGGQNLKAKRDDKRSKLRIVKSPDVQDQSLSMVAKIMNGIPILDAYTYELDGGNPMVLFDRATDMEQKIEDRTKAVTALAQNFPYFMAEPGFYRPSEYRRRIAATMNLASIIDLPVIGVYASRVDSILKTQGKHQASARTEQFYRSCASLPEATWNNQRSIYAHLLTNEDIDGIEKIRKKLKLLSESEREQIHTEVNIDLIDVTGRAEELLRGFAQQEQWARMDSLGEIADDPGSKDRLAKAAAAIHIHSAVVNERFAKDSRLLPEHTEGTGPSNLPRTVAGPLTLTDDAALQAAKFITRDVPEEELEQELARIAAMFRTFVHDARRNRVFHADAWRRLNESLAAALADQGRSLPEPLGDLEVLLGKPRTEILLALQGSHYGTARDTLEAMHTLGLQAPNPDILDQKT